jgi:nuclear transport factor 2 (NTF2) superfamily protein
MSGICVPCLPLTGGAAVSKVRATEDAWNTGDPGSVSLEFSLDTAWRDRVDLLRGRAAVVRFLQRKWSRELDHRVAMELLLHSGDRIALRFVSEWHDDSGNWFRSFGNESWEINAAGLVARRIAAVNDQPIRSAERRLHWFRPGPRPEDHPGPGDLGL